MNGGPGPEPEPGRGHGERGMVTAEIALGMIPLVVITLLLGWGLNLVTGQILLEDAASEVARQSARGDTGAVARARSDAPDGTRFRVERAGDATVVHAERTSTMPGSVLDVTLRAQARVLNEPGATP